METREIASRLGIDDRMEIMANKQAFITLKDHKDNFDNNPTCRLINPAKSEMGLVSKQILDKINNNIRSSINVNQWKNSASVIDWFNSIPNKSRFTFIVFDIVDFYPSISEGLLEKAINFARQHTQVTEQDVSIIMHSRKSLLFDHKTSWVKKDGAGMFDVTMGSYDGAEVCELVGLYILSTLSNMYKKENIGLYRDDGLAIFENISGNKADRIRKDITKVFHDLGLKITIEIQLKIVNYLDITLNLTDGTYSPYRKPNDQPLYINTKSNHPPSIIKQLPAAISKRISDISHDKDVFEKSAPLYDDALKASGYNEKLSYTEKNVAGKRKKNRQRKIIWFNPPYSKTVQTNVGKTFLHLIEKHFPKTHKLHKIFNKGNVKVSYSCMENMASILKAHNKNITEGNTPKQLATCNCRNKAECPLDGKCLSHSIIYNAHITTDNNRHAKVYVGLTEKTFKQRYSNHKHSIRDRKYEHATELSKHIWTLKDKGQDYNIKWSISKHATAYTNKTKRCNLCLTEKLTIINADKSSLLNKRSELISKCRHENKYYVKNYKNDPP